MAVPVNSNIPNQIGSCEIAVGCMASGKSSYVISKTTQAADLGFTVAYVNYSKDIRLTESADNTVTTHNSGFQRLSKKIVGFKTDNLKELEDELLKFDVIGIDEYQFFTNVRRLEAAQNRVAVDLEEQDAQIQNQLIRNLVLKHGKRVIIGSLDYDYKLQPFGKVHELFGLCGPGDVNKLYAICQFCPKSKMQKAGWTLKMPGGKDEIIEVGGLDKYKAVCMPCYMKWNTY